jgi:hypothetical protein
VASAIVPLLVTGPYANIARVLQTHDPDMVVWRSTRAECIHAICRRYLDGSFSGQDEQRARDRLEALAER